MCRLWRKLSFVNTTKVFCHKYFGEVEKVELSHIALVWITTRKRLKVQRLFSQNFSFFVASEWAQYARVFVPGNTQSYSGILLVTKKMKCCECNHSFISQILDLGGNGVIIIKYLYINYHHNSFHCTQHFIFSIT